MRFKTLQERKNHDLQRRVQDIASNQLASNPKIIKEKHRSKMVYSNDRKVVFENGKTIYNTKRSQADIKKGSLDGNIVRDKHGKKMTFGEFRKANK